MRGLDVLGRSEAEGIVSWVAILLTVVLVIDSSSESDVSGEHGIEALEQAKVLSMFELFSNMSVLHKVSFP